jgi:hypothetical protein
MPPQYGTQATKENIIHLAIMAEQQHLDSFGWLEITRLLIHKHHTQPLLMGATWIAIYLSRFTHNTFFKNYQICGWVAASCVVFFTIYCKRYRDLKKYND